MAKFPFVVEPRLKAIIDRIGSEEAGFIEIKRQGYLSVGERNSFQQIMQQDDTTGLVLSLVRRAAAELKVDLEEAYKAVSDSIMQRFDSDLSNAIMDHYENDISRIAEVMINAEMSGKIAKAYVMLAYRIDQNVDLTDLQDLHPDILEGLVVLFNEEEAKSQEKLLAALNDGKTPGEEASTETATLIEEAQKKSKGATK